MDRITALVIELPGKYNVKGNFLRECAQAIREYQASRDKPMSDDHMKQVAVKWCRETQSRRDAYWKEWTRQPTLDEFIDVEKKRLGYWGWLMANPGELESERAKGFA